MQGVIHLGIIDEFNYLEFYLSINFLAQIVNFYVQEVTESFDFWGTPEGDVVHPAECMEQLLEKVRRHKVNIDGNVCTVMVTFLVLEVILSSLC